MRRSSSRIIRSLLGGVLTFAMCSTGAALAAQPEGDSPCKVTITMPQAGDRVGKDGRVRGTATIPGGTYLWVLAHMMDLSAEWWPQGGRPAVIESDGKWVIIAAYGESQDVQQPFEVAAVVVDANTNDRLRQWVAEGRKTNSYPPIDFPSVVQGCVPVRVVVTKTAH